MTLVDRARPRMLPRSTLANVNGIPFSGASEEQIERSVEAPFAVIAVIGLQALLALTSQEHGWQLWKLPGWVWLIPIIPESFLVIALIVHQRIGRGILGSGRRTVSLGLVGVVAAANGLALVMLIGSLLEKQSHSGAVLLFKAITIWGTNVVTFGLFFWEMDGGGPDRRLISDWELGSGSYWQRDFQFPQMENPKLTRFGRNWRSHLTDYVFLSFTNSIAFSPTDAMPLTQRAKLLMMGEAAVSAVTVLLVAARAVNILT